MSDVLENRLYNYILRLKKEIITNELLGDVYNELMEASAFIVEMKQNLLVRACDEISPELLFGLASTYMCCACLYELCYKAYYNNGDCALEERTAADLRQPIEQLLSEEVKDALYQFFYNKAVGLPIERDIQNNITLPMFGIASGKNLLDSAEKVACSQIPLSEKREVLMDEQLLKACKS